MTRPHAPKAGKGNHKAEAKAEAKVADLHKQFDVLDHVDESDFAALKSKILDTGLSVSELASTAWASAASFRGVPASVSPAASARAASPRPHHRHPCGAGCSP